MDAKNMMAFNEQRTRFYLGDGVYVSFSGYDYTLYTDREDGRHFLVLDNEMIRALYNEMTRRSGV